MDTRVARTVIRSAAIAVCCSQLSATRCGAERLGATADVLGSHLGPATYPSTPCDVALRNTPLPFLHDVNESTVIGSASSGASASIPSAAAARRSILELQLAVLQDSAYQSLIHRESTALTDDEAKKMSDGLLRVKDEDGEVFQKKKDELVAAMEIQKEDPPPAGLETHKEDLKPWIRVMCITMVISFMIGLYSATSKGNAPQDDTASQAQGGEEL